MHLLIGGLVELDDLVKRCQFEIKRLNFFPHGRHHGNELKVTTFVVGCQIVHQKGKLDSCHKLIEANTKVLQLKNFCVEPIILVC